MKRLTLFAISLAVLTACGNTTRGNKSDNARDSTDTRPATNVDTMATRHEAADRDTLKQADGKGYSQKQLNEIMEIISKRLETLDDKRLRQNIPMYGIRQNDVEVYMIMNTPEMRRAFREKVLDSPAIAFTGDETPPPDPRTGPQDTLGIVLRPEFTLYPTDAQTATFILANNGNCTILCGDHYSITYDDGHGTWRKLPMNSLFNDIGYLVRPGGSRKVTARLYPDLHTNRAGRYRLFYKVARHESYGDDIMMMTEFILTDDKNAAVRAEKTLIPIYIANKGIDDDTVYDIVEQMPQFPGGTDSLQTWLKAHTHHPKGTDPDVKGRVVVTFIVMEDGSLEDVKVVRSIDPLLDREAVQIVKRMPKWIPGQKNGKIVKVKFTLPVNFR